MTSHSFSTCVDHKEVYNNDVGSLRSSKMNIYGGNLLLLQGLLMEVKRVLKVFTLVSDLARCLDHSERGPFTGQEKIQPPCEGECKKPHVLTGHS